MVNAAIAGAADMQNMEKRFASLVTVLAILASTPVFATVITVDENGHGFGTIGSGFLGADPGPGGLGSVLIYNLGFAGIQGDVFISSAAEGINDVIRFNGNGTLIFYSDNLGGLDALADTLSPPAVFYSNTATILEIGPEGNNGAFYTPLANQPGFNPADAITYHFVSDGTAQVPEPATIALFGTGIIAIASRHRRKRKGRV
jgi:hypothetical protein